MRKETEHDVNKWIHTSYPGNAVGLKKKNPPANAGDTRDAGSIPGSGISPEEEEMTTHAGILAWKILWTEKPGGLQSMGSQRVRHNRVTHTHIHT